MHLSTVSNIYGGTGWTSPCTCYLDGSLIRQELPDPDMFVQGVGDVLHDDIGSVALHPEVIDGGDIGVVEAGSESGLSLGWIEERERSCIGGEWSGAIPYRR